jgi:hypothetical protein
MQTHAGMKLIAVAFFSIGFGNALAQHIPATQNQITSQLGNKISSTHICPVEGQLRVASAGSLTGFQMLDACGPEKIIIAPASVQDYIELLNTPEDPRAHHVPARGKAVGNDTNIVRITPKKAESFGFDPYDTPNVQGNMLSPEAILSMRPIYTTPYDNTIARVARRHRIDPLLLHAVIKQESQYKTDATSRAGARGLMQLMPATAEMLDIGAGSITHAESNVDGGARLLRRLHHRFNDLTLVLAAYNAGEGAVAKYGNRIPPYAETQQYVEKVMANYQKLLADQQVVSR